MKDQLSLTFTALSDPTRRAILLHLSKEEVGVSELAKPFLKKMSLPAISKHIRILEDAGLIIKTKEAQWRPCRINAKTLKDASEWMEQYRIFWEESFDRLDDYLKTLNVKNKTKKKSGAKK